MDDWDRVMFNIEQIKLESDGLAYVIMWVGISYAKLALDERLEVLFCVPCQSTLCEEAFLITL